MVSLENTVRYKVKLLLGSGILGKKDDTRKKEVRKITNAKC